MVAILCRLLYTIISCSVCRLRYGDVSAYLEACGFSIEEQKRMRQALTVS